MTKQLYLVNKLSNKLNLKGGYTIVHPKSHVQVTVADLAEQTIAYAISRDWVEVTDTKPEHVEGGSAVEIDVTEPYQGLTEAELKAEREAEALKPAVDVANTEELGKGNNEAVEATEPAPKKRKAA